MAQTRLHIVRGMLLACSNLDAVIQTIRAAQTSVEAKQQLQAPEFGLSVEQAEAILSMQLRRLTALEQDRLEAEAADLGADVARLSALLSERSNVEAYISAELVELKAAHATPRLSAIELEYEELSDMDLTPQQACVIVQVPRPPALPRRTCAAPNCSTPGYPLLPTALAGDGKVGRVGAGCCARICAGQTRFGTLTRSVQDAVQTILGLQPRAL
eukprot:scaffold8056_cov114-Isochrysis_galbana.AAC.5